MAGEQPAADLESASDASQTIGESERIGGGIDVKGDEELFEASRHASVTVAPVSTVPTRSAILEILWRSMYDVIPSSSFGQINGSTKLAVPTWTAVAPAIMNSSASRASAMPPMPMIGILTACRHS